MRNTFKWHFEMPPPTCPWNGSWIYKGAHHLTINGVYWGNLQVYEDYILMTNHLNGTKGKLYSGAHSIISLKKILENDIRKVIEDLYIKIKKK